LLKVEGRSIESKGLEVRKLEEIKDRRIADIASAAVPII
jgi:hypothetical protein